MLLAARRATYRFGRLPQFEIGIVVGVLGRAVMT